MRMKILICGYNHYNFVDAITEGFSTIEGLIAESFCHEYVPTWKQKERNFLRRLHYRRRVKTLASSLLDKAVSFCPDLILVVEGCCLEVATVERLKNHALVFLWCLDSLQRLKISHEQLGAYDKVFVFDEADRSIWPKANYLPIGYDPKIYYPIKGQAKIYDLVWVGSPHADRLNRLEEISGFCLENRIKFGVFGQFFKDKKRREFNRKYPKLSQVLVRNECIFPTQANEIYNQAKLAVNFHSSLLTETAFNARTWEAMAAGAVILTDFKPAMLEEIVHGVNGFIYHNIGDLCHQLPEILENRAVLTKVREAGLVKAFGSHTFRSRVAAMISFVKDKRCLLEKS